MYLWYIINVDTGYVGILYVTTTPSLNDANPVRLVSQADDASSFTITILLL